MRLTREKRIYFWIKKEKFFSKQYIILKKKRIFNALKNSSSDSVIKFKDVLKKIINGK